MRNTTTLLAAGLAIFFHAAICVVLLATPAAAQEGAPVDPPVEGFFESVDIEVVNIDVWVTDKDGHHVTGLEREDFEVLRDDSQVPVSNFYAVENGRPTEPTPVVAELDREVPPLPERLESVSPLPPEHRLWLIVYLDNFNSDPIERNRTLPALRQFLGETLRPGDQVMLVSYNRSLKVRLPFTGSVERIFAVLEEVYDDAGLATIRRREQMDTLKQISDSKRDVTALSLAMNYADSQMIEVEETVEAMEELIESMGGLPGRKALVYLSSGVPMVAGEEMFYAVAEQFDESRAYAEIGRHDTSRYFERLARKANTHRVVFYPLDAGGFRGLQFGAAEYGDFVSPNLRRTLDSVVVENLHAPLRLLADETGGRAILNRNEALPVLEQVSEDLRTFYSLGIINSNADQGRYHQLKVQLVDKELRKLYQVRHRSGYRSRSMDARMEDSLRSALLYGYEENPIGLETRWSAPARHGDEALYLMQVQLKIPLRDLVLLPIAGGKSELRLRLYVGVADERGDTSEIDHVPVGLRIDTANLEAAKGESFLYTHKLLLSAGRKKVGLAILDMVGRQSSFVARAVQVGPAGDFQVKP